MRILNHICLKVSIEVLWNLVEKARVRNRSMLFILPSFAEFALTIHSG